LGAKKGQINSVASLILKKMNKTKNDEYIDIKLIKKITILIISIFTNKSETNTKELQLLIKNKKKKEN
jgi:hypothetical protein